MIKWRLITDALISLSCGTKQVATWTALLLHSQVPIHDLATWVILCGRVPGYPLTPLSLSDPLSQLQPGEVDSVNCTKITDAVYQTCEWNDKLTCIKLYQH